VAWPLPQDELIVRPKITSFIFPPLPTFRIARFRTYSCGDR
jgi:hypothetical protein